MSQLPISLGEINDKNIEQFRVLNQVTFPVQYSPSFYQKVLTYGKYSRLAYHNDIMIGAMACREEEKDGQPSLYILTIGVLEAYRKHKIGSQLMDELLKMLKQDPSIKSIYLHMQVSNQTGLKFYEKYGFTITQTIEDYYTDIEPKACYILKKTL